jgi:hypothetical protein
MLALVALVVAGGLMLGGAAAAWHPSASPAGRLCGCHGIPNASPPTGYSALDHRPLTRGSWSRCVE